MNENVNDRERVVREIFARVGPTICTSWSSARGETIEGRIERDDFDVLIALARNPGGPVPVTVTRILSRRPVR